MDRENHPGRDAGEEPIPIHLAIIGGGVAGCAAASWAAAQGARITLINDGFPLGGSCIHVGTLPARLLMTAATDHHRCAHPRFPGIRTSQALPDWDAFSGYRRRIVKAISRQYLRQIVDDRENVTLIRSRASFLDSQTLQLGDQTLSPDRILLTPGSHSQRPRIDGLDQVGALPIEALMELQRLPESIAFLETSPASIAYAQALHRLGSQVILLTEEPFLFSSLLSRSSSEAISEILRHEGLQIFTQAQVLATYGSPGALFLEGSHNGGPKTWETAQLTYVDHRRPNTEGLQLSRAGIDLTDQGYIFIDETLQTTNPKVFAAGDAIGPGQHAYAAAYDAVLAAQNAINPSRRAGYTTVVPFSIYTDPEFAGVGWNEEQARRAGFSPELATIDLQDVPAARALGYNQGFVQLCRDPRSDQLLGARILAPHASELIMEVAIALRAGLTTTELCTVVHPTISLGAAISQAATLFST